LPVFLGEIPLRVLMLSWEYPPRIIGGLSRHVEGLSAALADSGNEVHVVTLDFPGAPTEEERGSVFIHRVAIDTPAPTFHTWVLLFNHFFEKRAGQVAQKYGAPDVVHVHDWLAVTGGVAVKHLLRVPLVMTFHSTESSRSSNSPSPESAMVEGLEWWGSYEAAKVIAVSGWMKSEVVDRFKLPPGKVAEIPNAVDPRKFEGSTDLGAVRRRWDVKEGERLITAVGRLTSQKGFDDLIRAYSAVRVRFPSSRLLLIGDGYMRGELETLAVAERVKEKVTFAGFLSDAEVVGALRASDVVAVPSHFEPFGIIALEAMASGAPVVVSRVGGLAEIVQDGVDGVEVEPNSPPSLAEGISRVLADGAFASSLAARGKEKANSYSWENASRRTQAVYEEAIRESRYE